MGRNRTVEYPSWAEMYRKPGCTLRKIRNGYGLYRCTSERLEDGSRKKIQEYLGKITEADGFIPKRGKQAMPRLEYGLSHMIWMNFAGELCRYSNQGRKGGDLVKLSIILFIFGKTDERFLRLSSLTFQNCDVLSELADKVSKQRLERLRGHIETLLRKKIPDEGDYLAIIHGLAISQAEVIPGGLRLSPLPEVIQDLLSQHRLKY